MPQAFSLYSGLRSPAWRQESKINRIPVPSFSMRRIFLAIRATTMVLRNVVPSPRSASEINPGNAPGLKTSKRSSYLYAALLHIFMVLKLFSDGGFGSNFWYCGTGLDSCAGFRLRARIFWIFFVVFAFLVSGLFVRFVRVRCGNQRTGVIQPSNRNERACFCIHGSH